MRSKLVLIDALYINTGGAKVILETLVKELYNRDILDNFMFLIDIRLDSELIPFIDNSNLFIIKPSVRARREFYLNCKNDFEKVVCLANLPPPVAINDTPVYIFFHNAHILKHKLGWLKLYSITSYVLKRVYIFLKNKRQYNWIVQTETMKRLIISKLYVSPEKIDVIPFYKKINLDGKDKLKEDGLLSFAYIADGQSQKNHKYLLNVLRHLFVKHSVNVTIYLTVSKNYTSLIKEIAVLKEMGMGIINLGAIPHSEIFELYKKVDYILYPSLIESFGLPLIEAASLGCNVIAINKRYVFDVIIPSAVFSTNNINDLADLIISLYSGKQLPVTKLVVKNCLNEFVDLLN